MLDQVLSYLSQLSVLRGESGARLQLSFVAEKPTLSLDEQVLQAAALIKELANAPDIEFACAELVRNQFVRPGLLPVGFVEKLTTQEERECAQLLQAVGTSQVAKEALAPVFTLQAVLEQERAKTILFTPRTICAAVLVVSDCVLVA